MFKVFGELSHRIRVYSGSAVIDNGIGVGLSCSKTIAKALKGDVSIKPYINSKTEI